MNARALPAAGWLTGYRRSWLRGDLIAALTVWALVVPQAIAYANIAGLPPQSGLFATFAALLAYALLGTSRQLIVSPTSSTAAISAALVAPLAMGDRDDFVALSAALALLVGTVLVVLGLLKMGFVSRFIAEAVTTGFMVGLGFFIIAGQLGGLLGIPVDADGFFPKIADLVSHLGEINGWTAAIGLGGLALVLGLGRLAPWTPAPLLLIAAGIAVVAVLDLADQGVAVIGELDGALPTPKLPLVGWTDLMLLLPGALAVAVIGYAESTTVAESMAEEHGYEIRPDQELRAVGTANVLAGLFQGFITGGGASQSAANDRAGARTPLVSLIVSGLTVLTAVALLPLFRDLPQAALSAIVISAVLGFINIPALRRIARLRRDSFVLAMVAMAGVLLLGVLPGLILAVAISVLLVLVRLARPRSSVLGRLPGGGYAAVGAASAARAEPGVLVYRLDAPLLALNAKLARDEVRALVDEATVPVRVVVLDLGASSDLDVSGISMLTALKRDLHDRGAELRLAGVHHGVRTMLDRGGLTTQLGESRIFRTVEDAGAASPPAAGRAREDR
ncbi:MAG: sulfate permease [Sporichthyaceae bacterium]|nr:sulfate permease [Sporichthyaceae bacterium]